MNNRIFHSQLFQLIIAHFKELTRQPAVLFWGIIFPILMSLGLGIAFTQKTDIVRNVAIVGSPPAAEGAAGNSSKIDAFLDTHAQKIPGAGKNSMRYKMTTRDPKLGNTTFYFIQTTWARAMVMLKRGSISLVINEKNRRIQYHFDPLNPDAQLTYLKLSRLLSANPAPAIKTEVADIHPLTVTGTRYIDFLIPGLIAMGVMMSCMWGIGYGTIEKRSKKLLRRMVATPMKKSYFLIALMTVRILMTFIESVLLFIFAHYAFGITIQGSLPALLIVFIAGNIAFGGIGIFTASRTSNTEIGNGLINVVVLPMMVLSGIFFSYHNFPAWSIPYIKIFPLTMLADGIRSIFIEGAGFAQIALPSLVLLGVGILCFTAGLRIFKWH